MDNKPQVVSRHVPHNWFIASRGSRQKHGNKEQGAFVQVHDKVCTQQTNGLIGSLVVLREACMTASQVENDEKC